MSERTDELIKELGYKTGKPKTNQPQTPNEVQGRLTPTDNITSIYLDRKFNKYLEIANA